MGDESMSGIKNNENFMSMEKLANYFDRRVPIQLIEKQMDLLLEMIEELNSYRKSIRIGIELARVNQIICLYIKRYTHLEKIFEVKKIENRSEIETM